MSLINVKADQLKAFPGLSAGLIRLSKRHETQAHSEDSDRACNSSLRFQTNLDLDPARKLVRGVLAAKVAMHESVKVPAVVSKILAPNVLCDQDFVLEFWRTNTDTQEGHNFMLSEPMSNADTLGGSCTLDSTKLKGEDAGVDCFVRCRCGNVSPSAAQRDARDSGIKS